MPELPDVETFKQYVEATALHQTISGVEVRHLRILRGITPEELGRELTGRSFTAARRHGKHLLLQLSGGKWLAVHFGMTGSFAYLKNKEKEPPLARLLIVFENGSRLAYVSQRMLGGIELVEEADRYLQERDLGTDALDNAFDLAAFKKILAGKRGISKAALMDQQAVAGIGNIYSDEILFQAGLHPKRPVASLTQEEAERLFAAMKRVLRTAIDHRAVPEDFPDSYLIPRRRSGKECPKCGAKIRQEKIAGRTSYYCPQCQK